MECKCVTTHWGEIDNIYPLILAGYPLLLKGFPQINRLGLNLCIKTIEFNKFPGSYKNVTKELWKTTLFLLYLKQRFVKNLRRGYTCRTTCGKRY